jgi:hypothetical protein
MTGCCRRARFWAWGTRVSAQSAPTVIISEVHPTGSNASYAADWFEVTNTGTVAIDISGWRVDDSSNAFSSAVALRGVTSIEPGKSAVFESDETERPTRLLAAFSLPGSARRPRRPGSSSAPTAAAASASAAAAMP